MASKSNITCDFVGGLVAKTFVDADKLREPQYAKCMENYHAQCECNATGKMMPEQDLLNQSLK